MVEEFIEQSSIPAYMPDEMKCIINADDLEANQIKIKGNKSNGRFVLIVPPDKSMALIMTEDKLILYDSHPHMSHGALISYYNKEQIDIFCNYIEKMVQKYFNSCLLQSNLIHIEMID